MIRRERGSPRRRPRAKRRRSGARPSAIAIAMEFAEGDVYRTWDIACWVPAKRHRLCERTLLEGIRDIGETRRWWSKGLRPTGDGHWIQHEKGVLASVRARIEAVIRPVAELENAFIELLNDADGSLSGTASLRARAGRSKLIEHDLDAPI